MASESTPGGERRRRVRHDVIPPRPSALTVSGGASTFALSDDEGGPHVAKKVVIEGHVQMCSLGRDKKW